MHLKFHSFYEQMRIRKEFQLCEFDVKKNRVVDTRSLSNIYRKYQQQSIQGSM